MPRLVCTMDADNGGRCVGSQFRGPHRKLDATMINLRFFLLLNLFVFFFRSRATFSLDDACPITHTIRSRPSIVSLTSS